MPKVLLSRIFCRHKFRIRKRGRRESCLCLWAKTDTQAKKDTHVSFAHFTVEEVSERKNNQTVKICTFVGIYLILLSFSLLPRLSMQKKQS